MQPDPATVTSADRPTPGGQRYILTWTKQATAQW
jgi:hypothetical protein